MTPDIDLKKLEKKAYLYFHQDGILDILIGFIILVFGIEMDSNIFGFFRFSLL